MRFTGRQTEGDHTTEYLKCEFCGHECTRQTLLKLTIPEIPCPNQKCKKTSLQGK